MDKIERKISYAIYKRELIFNSSGSFSHLDVLFGSCTEGPNFFSSKEESVRKDILGKLRQYNYVQEIKENPDINHFFRVTTQELLKDNIIAGIFLFQKNEYIEVISANVEKNDFRDFTAGRIVLINEKGNSTYRDVDCRSKNEDAKITDILISNFKKASVELRSKIINTPTTKQFDLNSASTIVFSPGTAGFLIHEIFGHLLEADLIVNKASVFGEKKLGDKIAVEGLNIIDDVSGYENYIGLNKLDDEGEDLKPIHLVRNGILSGFISNSFLNEKIKCKEAVGCSRRESYKKKSLPRMRATFIKENKKGKGLNRYIESINDGFIVNNIMNGNVEPTSGRFYLYCDSGAIIKNGQVKENIRDFFISGIIQDSLLNIREIGNDFKFFPTFCIKGGQQVPVCVGSPTVVIDSLNIGALNYGM